METTAEAAEAAQAVNRWVARWEPSYRLLARHAALPLVLTPDLLHFLREQFLRGRVPWIAEADLLLGELCRPVGYELFAMNTAVRAHLMTELRQAEGDDRVRDVARLLIEYVRHREREDSASAARRPELEAQQWAALVCLDEERGRVAGHIGELMGAALAEPALQPGAASTAAAAHRQAELARLSGLVAELAPQLADQPELIAYARTVGLLLSDPAGARTLFDPARAAAAPAATVRVAGVVLPALDPSRNASAETAPNLVAEPTSPVPNTAAPDDLPPAIVAWLNLYTLACWELLQRLPALRRAVGGNDRALAQCINDFDVALVKTFDRVGDGLQASSVFDPGRFFDDTFSELVQRLQARTVPNTARILQEALDGTQNRILDWNFSAHLERWHELGRSIARDFFARSPSQTTHALLTSSNAYVLTLQSNFPRGSRWWVDREEKRLILTLTPSDQFTVYRAHLFQFVHAYLGFVYVAAPDDSNPALRDAWMQVVAYHLLRREAVRLQNKDAGENVDLRQAALTDLDSWLEPWLTRTLSRAEQMTFRLAQQFLAWLGDDAVFEQITFELAAFTPDEKRPADWPDQFLLRLGDVFARTSGRQFLRDVFARPEWSAQSLFDEMGQFLAMIEVPENVTLGDLAERMDVAAAVIGEAFLAATGQPARTNQRLTPLQIRQVAQQLNRGVRIVDEKGDPVSTTEPEPKTKPLPASSFTTDPDGFLTEEGVRELVVQDLARPKKAGGMEVLRDVLLLFRTKRQRTWLAATSERLFFVLDDAYTRKSGKMIRRRGRHKEAIPVSTSLVERTSGAASHRVQIGAGNPWLYSPNLHPDPRELERHIRKMVGAAEESATDGEPFDVFVSYDSVAGAWQVRSLLLRDLLPRLEDAGLRVWVFDQQPSQEQKTAAIRKAIASSRWHVVLVTPNFERSRGANVEVDYRLARGGRETLVPVLIRRTELPEKLAGLAPLLVPDPDTPNAIKRLAAQLVARFRGEPDPESPIERAFS